MSDKIKILLVEDNPDTQLRMEALIHSLGYVIQKTVDNAQDAVQTVKQQMPDILVMDIDIKGDINGIEVVEILKDYNIPVIFTTGFDGESYYERAKETQPAAYLVKPFNKFTFQTALENAILSRGKNEIEEEDPWAGEIWLKDSFFVKRNNLLQKVRVEEIQYIQSDGNYCDIISNKKFAVKISLTQLLKKLPMNRFLRIHKSLLFRRILSKILTSPQMKFSSVERVCLLVLNSRRRF